MLDIAMLDSIAQGGTVPFRDGKPMFLENIFQQVAADGWRPRNPAYGAELEQLEAFVTRGHCLEPALMEGDIVYVDKTAAPQSGDIVSFTLSERFAAFQNEALPPFDARPCKGGDPWLKLFVQNCGIDMLLERYGHAMTTTFAACESPDGLPVLWPVRNVRRNGELLFLPHAHAGQIGLNAATDIVEVSTASYTGSAIAQAIATASVGAKETAYVATVTVSADVWKTNANGAQVYLAQLSGGIPTGTTSQSYFVTATSSPGNRISIVASFPVNTVGAATSFALWYSSGSVGNFGNASNIDLRVDIVKR